MPRRVGEVGKPAGAAHPEIGADDALDRGPQFVQGHRVVGAGLALAFGDDDPEPAGLELEHGDQPRLVPFEPHAVLGRLVEFDVAEQVDECRVGPGEADAGQLADDAAATVAADEVAT